MEKLDAREARRKGNDRFEGFVVDLAGAIADIVGFNLTIRLADGYGSVDEETGQWNGMIRELLEEVRIRIYFSARSAAIVITAAATPAAQTMNSVATMSMLTPSTGSTAQWSCCSPASSHLRAAFAT